MARPASEAERLRHCRLVFERSARDGVGMKEADKRLRLEQIAARAQRLKELRHPHSGTPAPDAAGFLDRVAAGSRAHRSSTDVYARHCALIGERDDQDSDA